MLCTIHCSLDLVLHFVRLVMRYKKESNISTHQCSLWVLYFGLLSNDLLTIVLGFLYVFIGIFADKAGSSNNETNKASKCCSLIWGSSLSLSLCIVACEHILCVCTCMWAGAIYLSMILASRLLLLLFFFFTFFFFFLLFLLLSDLLLCISILTLLVSSNFPSSKNADGKC